MMRCREGLSRFSAVLAVMAVSLYAMPGLQNAHAQADACIDFRMAILKSRSVSPERLQALQEQRISEARLKQTRSEFRPQLSGYARAAEGESGLLSGRTDNQVGFILSQRIYDFGQNKYQRRAAQARIDAAISTVESTGDRAVLETLLLYLAVLEAEERLIAIQEREDRLLTISDGSINGLLQA